NPPSQPHWKMATTTPSEAAKESRFIAAACTGITTERKTIISNTAASSTTTAMNSGSFAESVLTKSTWLAVGPPTSTVDEVLGSTLGRTSSRKWFTRSVVAWAWGAESE